tara:strand:- start:723 stop:1211 length:489 start_codon:yes stop_codon:yes gene_type:complete
MSLLLSGAKTITFAGTEMQCLEIYTGEAYTINLNFTDSVGSAIDITAWTLGASVTYYSVDTVTYNDDLGQINLGNITLDTPQGTDPTGLAVSIVSGPAGTAYLYVPNDLTDGTNDRPTVPLVNGKSDPSVLAIVTVNIQRTDAVSSLTNESKEPLGFIVRYQ